MNERKVWINLAKYWLVEEIRDKESGGITFIELLCNKKLLPAYSIYIAFDELEKEGTILPAAYPLGEVTTNTVAGKNYMLAPWPILREK